MTIIDKHRELGYATVDADFYRKVDEWKSWYAGDVKGFHRYRVRNGHGTLECKRHTLNMEKYEAFSKAAGLRTQYERMRVTYR